MDKFYFLHGERLLDKRLFKEIKDIATQQTLLSLGVESQSARLHTLSLEHSELTLSNASSSWMDWRMHKAAAFLFGVRTHSTRTLRKCHAILPSVNANNPERHAYYTHMYPTPNCPFCPNPTIETTQHIMTCPNNPYREPISVMLWNGIHHKVASVAAQSVAYTRKLFPFSLAPPPNHLLTHDLTHSRANLTPNSALKSLEQFPTELGNAGFIPKTLKQALRELGTPSDQVNSLATNIALRIHTALFLLYQLRCRYINNTRDQKKAYRHFILQTGPAPQVKAQPDFDPDYSVLEIDPKPATTQW